MALGQDLTRLIERVYVNELIPGLTVGLTATLRRTSGAAYDSATGATGGGGSEPETCRVMLRAYSHREIARGGGLIVAGDVQIRMLATDGFDAPAVDDTVTVDEADFRIVHVTPRYLDGAVGEYLCQGRR